MENLDRVIELVSSSTLPMIIALLKVTIPLTLLSFSLGLVIAIITAVARLSNIKILKFIFATYVWIFRGTPLLVQLFIVFYGLPSIGVTLDTWSAATIASVSYTHLNSISIHIDLSAATTHCWTFTLI